ncbi:prolyl oligopeptidase family serine peptidase [Aestuariimicrobium kwangyangense]|uniref:prolyl oligopeptidase family serine peptidase n=1 Tax=Aestuariimicrobium kwangyangense TaxID=396389 RepID=UPI0003B4455D|nr:prolyl oligopeptidase family serine peptidase [Aestuariimicrobium kwangyangense]
MPHPQTAAHDLVETLHGHRIADPYRWLEDPDSTATQQWVEAQRDWCEEVFAGIPERAHFSDLMRSIVVRERRGTPDRQSGWYLRSTNDGGQPQDSVVASRDLDEVLGGAAPVLLDPSTWSEDGTTSLGTVSVSPNGQLAAYTVSVAGSDWTSIRVLDLHTRTLRDDEVTGKFARPDWLPDSSGYLWFDHPGSGDATGTETKTMGEAVLKRHLLDGSDDLELWRAGDPDLHAWSQVLRAPGQRHAWLTVTTMLGTERLSDILVAPVDGAGVGELRALFGNRSAWRQPIGVDGDDLLVLTSDSSPMGRIDRVDLSTGRSRTLVPEGEWPIEEVAFSRAHLVVHTLEDAQPVLRRHDLTGADLGRVPLSGGQLMALSAERDSDEVLLGFSSVNSPRTSHLLDAASGRVTDLPGVAGSSEPLQVRTERRGATSTDGTEVPYFLISRADLGFDQTRPTLQYGYGGFHIPILADHRPGWEGWLRAGGVLVICNLRGGSEYGTAWYDAGRKQHKQRVFDDFIAVAEHLISTGVTTAGQLANYGRSNGGLLVGATLTQRPDLWAASIPQVGVLDLLRFHTFTVGKGWTSDYGNPDLPEDFEVALAYSPLHNVRPGAQYPATLVVTGDHDDRVVPAHSHKFTATLQAAQGGHAPIVSRIETATGHGPGKPLGMVADEWADVLAWAAHFTGLSVPGAHVD